MVSSRNAEEMALRDEPNNGCKGDLASFCDNSKQSQRFIYNLDIPAQSNSCDLRVPFLMQYVDIDRKSKTP